MVSHLPFPTPTQRFSNRADNYVKYRPGYPPAIVPFLEKEFSLHNTSRIADIGSGTGLFAEPLLQKNYTVICIEPNSEMRRAGEMRLGQYPSFISRSHTAEATGLRTASIDLITVAQAFHWFNMDAARKEFTRILKPGGHILLAWNIQRTDTPFLKNYAQLKETYRIDPAPSDKRDISHITQFFAPNNFHQAVFPNVQMLNFDALKGQLLSVSDIPLPGHPSYETMISALVQLFVACNENGFVRMEFETKLYWGLLDKPVENSKIPV